MKLVAKILGGIVLVLLLLIAGFYLHLSLTWEKDYADSPRPDIAASDDPAVIARGEYLVNAVAHCAICHQDVPAGSLSEAMLKNRESGVGKALSGGLTWDIPLFGRFVAANLTPDPETGIGALDDATLARVIRHGIDRNGRVAAFMSIATGPMADEDLIAVMSYIRSGQPARKDNPSEAPGLLGKLVIKKMSPREETIAWAPEGGISVERGEYLANGPAACYSCHSEANPMNGFAIDGPRFRGTAQPEPDGIDPAFEIVIPNLTPDPATGHIVSWSEEEFLTRFRAGPVIKGSKMPWENYALMTEDDLRSLYRYLRTLEPVVHDVGPIRRAAGWKRPES
jgi:mono/diheme cytochrome c family protein